MTPRMLRNAGLTSITALSLALVACGGSSTSTPPVPPVVNQAPINAAITGSDSMATGHVKDFALNATDPEGKAITYTVTASAGTVAVTGNVAKLTAPAAPGTVVLTMTAKDADGATATAVKTVTVNANQAPIFNNNLPNNGTAQVTAVATSTVTINLNATDNDGDTVTVAPGTLPTWAAFNATTKVLTLTPAVADVNVLPYNLIFTATDGFGGTTTLTLAVTVNRGVNNPPSTPLAVAVTPQNTHVGRELKWNLAAIDPDGDAVTFFQPLLSDAEVTITGSVLTWKPTAATSGKTIYVSALDARNMQSVTPLALSLPAVSANSLPSWSMASFNSDGSPKNGTGIANPALPGLKNAGVVYKDSDGTTVYNTQQTTVMGTWGTAGNMLTAADTVQVPTGVTLTWNPTYNSTTEVEYVYDADSLDTLTFGYTVQGTTAVPAGFTMNATTGLVTYVPVDADAAATFGVGFNVTDGLATHRSQTYKFSGRTNLVPVVTTKLNANKAVWIDPFAAVAQPVAGWPNVANAAGIDPDGDLALFEPVSCSNASIWLGNLRFGTTAANAPTSGLSWALKTTKTGPSFEALTPFTDVTVGYRLRDNFNGVSATETATFKVAGQAKFTRKVTHVWPGSTSVAPEAATALTAYPFVDAATPTAGFYMNMANTAYPSTNAAVDPMVASYTIKELKAPNFLLNFPSADAKSSMGGFTNNLRVLTNGGTGATVANLDETVWGRPAAVATPEISTGAVTLFGAPVYPVFYNAADAFATTVNGAGVQNSTVPGSITLVDLGAVKQWIGTDAVGAPVTQNYYGATQQATGTGVANTSVTQVAAFAPGATTKTFNLVWTRSAFEAQFAKLNVTAATKTQQFYIAQSWKAVAQGLPVYNSPAAEIASLTQKIALNGATFFSYSPNGVFDTDPNKGVDIVLNNVSYKASPIAEHDTYNVVLTGGTKAFAGGANAVLPATMGVRSALDPNARALTPVIAPVSGLKITVQDVDDAFDAKVDQDLGVTTENVNLSWTAPAVGTAAEYVVEVFDVTANVAPVAVAKFVVNTTNLELPTNLFTANQVYAFRVRAKSAVGTVLEQGWADALSGNITW